MKTIIRTFADLASCAGSLAIFHILFQIPFTLDYLMGIVFLFSIIEVVKRM